MTQTATALDGLVGRKLPEASRSWAVEDCMRYALAVGAGHPAPAEELNLTTENTRGQPLQALPTLGIVLAADTDALLAVLGVSGGDVLLLSDLIEMQRPLPTSGTLRTRSEILEVTPHRLGHVVEVGTNAVTAADEQELFRTTSRTLVRAPASERAPDDSTAARARVRTAAPRPDLFIMDRINIAPNQALLYRLSGGRNALHSDPAVFNEAGFDRPLLQGRCTLGFVARALTRALCDGDPTKLRTLGARMTGPVWAGDALRLEAWGTPERGEFQVVRESGRNVVLDRGVFTCDR